MKATIVRKTSIINSIKDGECRWIRSRAEAFIQPKVGVWIKIFTKEIFMIRSIINKNYYYLLLHIEVKLGTWMCPQIRYAQIFQQSNFALCEKWRYPFELLKVVNQSVALHSINYNCIIQNLRNQFVKL